MLGRVLLPILAVATAVAAASNSTVYLIRHGEKPADDGQGLSPRGKKRAQCLRDVFGAASEYNIGYIIAEEPEDNGDRTRPLETVKPLADDLGLKVDTSCDKEDPDCVQDLVDDYDGGKNILICWEHSILTDIAEELGDDDAPEYPDDRFDIIWTDPFDYGKITSETSENCPGLDDKS